MSKKTKFVFKVAKKDFTKSSFSKNNPQACVIVANKPEGVASKDSKGPPSPRLFLIHDEWAAFKQGIANGEF